MNKPTAQEVTPELIAKWKEQFGKVTKWSSKDGKVLFFRTPTRAEISAAQKVAQEKDAISSNQVLAKAACLGGDVEILEQDKYLIGMGTHLKLIVDTVEGELQEL